MAIGASSNASIYIRVMNLYQKVVAGRLKPGVRSIPFVICPALRRQSEYVQRSLSEAGTRGLIKEVERTRGGFYQ